MRRPARGPAVTTCSHARRDAALFSACSLSSLLKGLGALQSSSTRALNAASGQGVAGRAQSTDACTCAPHSQGALRRWLRLHHRAGSAAAGPARASQLHCWGGCTGSAAPALRLALRVQPPGPPASAVAPVARRCTLLQPAPSDAQTSRPARVLQQRYAAACRGVTLLPSLTLSSVSCPLCTPPGGVQVSVGLAVPDSVYGMFSSTAGALARSALASCGMLCVTCFSGAPFRCCARCGLSICCGLSSVPRSQRRVLLRRWHSASAVPAPACLPHAPPAPPRPAPPRPPQVALPAAGRGNRAAAGRHRPSVRKLQPACMLRSAAQPAAAMSAGQRRGCWHTSCAVPVVPAAAAAGGVCPGWLAPVHSRALAAARVPCSRAGSAAGRQQQQLCGAWWRLRGALGPAVPRSLLRWVSKAGGPCVQQRVLAELCAAGGVLHVLAGGGADAAGPRLVSDARRRPQAALASAAPASAALAVASLPASAQGLPSYPPLRRRPPSRLVRTGIPVPLTSTLSSSLRPLAVTSAPPPLHLCPLPTPASFSFAPANRFAGALQRIDATCSQPVF